MGADSMGRWTYTKLSRSGGHLITMIGLYQPPAKTATTAGPKTAESQLHAMLMHQQHQNPHRVRQHFDNDLILFVKRCQAKEHRIWIGGDFNDTLGDKNEELTKLCTAY